MEHLSDLAVPALSLCRSLTVVKVFAAGPDDGHEDGSITAAGVNGLMTLPRLSELRIDGSGIDGAMVRAVSSGRLAKISLNNSSEIDDEHWIQLFRAVGPQLVELDLAYTYQTDTTVIEAGRSCPNLTLVDFLGCAVGDEGMLSVVRGCPGLRRVRVGGAASLVSDTSLVALSKLDLTHCTVWGCAGVTNTGAIALEKCRNLTHLHLNHCSIDEAGKRRMREAFPHADFRCR